MANLNLENSTANQASEVQTPIIDNITTRESESASKISGLSPDEFNDPNKIVVTISDSVAPLVILFGPPSCGKTMTLVRLTRFLHKNGFTVSPIRNFRPAGDSYYKKLCDNFDVTINQNAAAGGNNLISFMLVEVIRNGRRLCQILEAPGEFYFNPAKPNEQFPNYVNTIINRNNRKIWVMMVEPDWLNQADRMNYVSKIRDLKRQMRARDKTIFVLNKIDKTNFVINPGNIHVGHAKKQVHFDYPNIFVPFLNQNPITRWWNEHLFDFVPFQTGSFSETVNGGRTFDEGPDEYPRMFWNTVLKRIRG